MQNARCFWGLLECPMVVRIGLWRWSWSKVWSWEACAVDQTTIEIIFSSYHGGLLSMPTDILSWQCFAVADLECKETDTDWSSTRSPARLQPVPLTTQTHTKVTTGQLRPLPQLTCSLRKYYPVGSIGNGVVTNMIARWPAAGSNL